MKLRGGDDDSHAGDRFHERVEGVDVAGGEAVDELTVLLEGLGVVGLVGVVHRLVHVTNHRTWAAPVGCGSNRI